MKGPGIFLAQFAGDEAPFNTLPALGKWVADMGYKGDQIPTWDRRLFDLKLASESDAYCDEVKGRLADLGLEVSELSTHSQGQLVAVHPAYDEMFDGGVPSAVRGNPAARQAWPYFYPYPQRPAGLVEEAFDELARRWRPILDAYEEAGVDLCYEVHPSEDLFDGATVEMFWDRVDYHPRACLLYDPSHFVLQQLDYLEYIDLYHERIRMFHVKDAEFRPTGRQGVYSGYQPWKERAGRFRSLGDGQVDFRAIFSKFAQYGYEGWAVLEWECALKAPEDGAREGAPFIRDHIINVTGKSFDDFVATGVDAAANRRMLGLDR